MPLTRILALLLALAAPAAAVQDKKEDPKAARDDGKKDEDKKDDKKNESPKTVAQVVERCERIPGLFDLYRHRTNGELYALIRPDQLGREYIHFTYTENGVARVGHFRGNFRGSRIFTIERDYDRLRFIVVPTAWHFDPGTALARAADANISPAVLAAPKIVAEGTDKDGEHKGALAVYVGGMLLKELWHQVKPSDSSKSGNRFKLGGLSDERTRIRRIRNYPQNTDIVVDYTYADIAPKVRAGEEDGVVDSRYVTITLQHSLIEMPKNDYEPRFDDERVGYFLTRVDDMTTTAATPWRDLIHRWHLKKKDPAAEVSEPVKPIVFWIENTTPVKWRETIRDAALRWNLAFEAAGFRNAVVVRQQPDDAKWDAGDIRYNVLRWTSSPDPPFGGYGPSFVNPRTGQILGADIMLEWIYLTNRVRLIELYTDASGGPERCSAGLLAHENTMAGMAVLRAFEAPAEEEHRLLKESLYYLVLHEIGHTLGLNHNMAASTLHDPDAVHDAERTSRMGLTGSVMDYPATNLAPPGRKQGQFWTDRPGPYDHWAITFGYGPDLDEPAARTRHLARSGDPALIFGNDADDMRSSSRGIDPRVMINDMTSDPVAWAGERLALVRTTLARLKDRYTAKGRSPQEIRNAYFSLQRHRQTCATVLSRHIGGVHVDRSAAAAKDGDARLYAPVEADVQRRAMQVLAERVFAPAALDDPEPLLTHLRAQRRGFAFFDKTEDPKLHDSVRRIHSAALDHLLHGTTLKRMTDARLYGNAYPVGEMLGDLTRAVFEADRLGPLRTTRQNLQIDYVQRLIRISDLSTRSNGFDDVARSAATWQLARILERLPDPKRNVGADAETRAHHHRLRLLIGRALDPRR